MASKYEEGSVREVAHVAWPIVVGMLTYTAMGVADTIVVGWLGTTEIAAVGLATTAVFLFNSFFVGTIHGVKVVVAQKTGANDHAAAARAGWTGALLAVPFGLAVIGFSSFDEELFAMLGPANVGAVASVYFGVRVLASVPWYILIAFSDYFQGTGDTRTPMHVNLVVNGLNIALDVVFVFGLGPIPAMGVAGAAWATVAASVVGWALITALFLRRVGARSLVVRAEELREVLRLGLPIGVRYLLDVAGFAVFTALIADMGEDELAANQIAIKVLSVSFLPGYGLSEATTILAGNYFGAGKAHRIGDVFRSATVLATGVMGTFAIVFWVFPEELMSIFMSSDEVARLGAQVLFVAAFFQLVDAVAFTSMGALNGLGRTQYTMYASIGSKWLVMVPMAWLLAVYFELGLVGAWLGLTAEIFVISALMTAKLYSVLRSDAELLGKSPNTRKLAQ